LRKQKKHYDAKLVQQENMQTLQRLHVKSARLANILLLRDPPLALLVPLELTLEWELLHAHLVRKGNIVTQRVESNVNPVQPASTQLLKDQSPASSVREMLL
jgi:hypothetical protein